MISNKEFEESRTKVWGEEDVTRSRGRCEELGVFRTKARSEESESSRLAKGSALDPRESSPTLALRSLVGRPLGHAVERDQ